MYCTLYIGTQCYWDNTEGTVYIMLAPSAYCRYKPQVLIRFYKDQASISLSYESLNTLQKNAYRNTKAVIRQIFGV